MTNLTDHLDETFNPIGEGDITSEFLKSWIFLKKSVYKNKPLLDVRTAMKLVKQHRSDKRSVSTEIVNPPYSGIFKYVCGVLKHIILNTKFVSKHFCL